MLDLSLITDDRNQCVRCNSVEQVEEFIQSVRLQRPDIKIGEWTKTLTSSNAGQAYFMNYMGNKRIQHGDPVFLCGRGYKIVEFDALFMHDLDDMDANQTGILSLLGL